MMINPIFEVVRNPYAEADKMIAEGRFRYGEAWWFSFVLSVFVVIGFIAAARERVTCAEIAVPLMLVIIIIWPFETFRYTLPMIPFIIYYFLMGVNAIWKLIAGSRFKWGLALSALAAVVGFHLYGNSERIIGLHLSSALEGPVWIQKFEAVETLFKRLEQESKETDIIASTNPALITLYTGRRTVAWDNPPVRWETWKKIPVKYLVWIMVYPTPPHPIESQFRTVYAPRDGTQFRIVDFGDPQTRPDWKMPTSN
jgi:hypothetical protein